MARSELARSNTLKYWYYRWRSFYANHGATTSVAASDSNDDGRVCGSLKYAGSFVGTSTTAVPTVAIVANASADDYVIAIALDPAAELITDDGSESAWNVGRGSSTPESVAVESCYSHAFFLRTPNEPLSHD